MPALRAIRTRTPRKHQPDLAKRTKVRIKEIDRHPARLRAVHQPRQRRALLVGPNFRTHVELRGLKPTATRAPGARSVELRPAS